MSTEQVPQQTQQPTQQPTQTEVQEAQPPQEILKVFVGNLPFSVKDDGLKEICKDCGEITDAQIIRFGSRSKGFGFVDFATKEQAQNSVKTLNGKDYQGRSLVVEIARPKELKPSKEPNSRSLRIDESTTEGEVQQQQSQNRKPRRFLNKRRNFNKRRFINNKRKQQQRKSQEPQQNQENENNENDDQESGSKNNNEVQERKPIRKNKYVNKKRYGQRKVQRSPPKPLGEALKDSIFVDNLPYRHYQGEDQPTIPYREPQLKELLESKGIEVNDVRVVNRSNPVTRRSRGLGFVQLKNEADQQKAINELNGSQVGRRRITVKVAKERLEQQASTDNNGANEGQQQKEGEQKSQENSNQEKPQEQATATEEKK